MKKILKYIILAVVLCAVIGAVVFAVRLFAGGGKAAKIDLNGKNNILVLGMDKDGYRSDIVLLCQLDAQSNKVNILQIPRDTMIETKRADKKINSVYGLGGEDELFSVVKDKFGVKCDKYVVVSLNAFRVFIDEIGGVDINVPIRMYYTDPTQNLVIDLQQGFQHLNGEKAEMFIRFRKNNDGTGYAGDIGRMEAQKEFYSAVFHKLLSVNSIAKIPKLYSIFSESVKTNLKAKDVMDLMTEALRLDKSNITIHDAPGEADYIKGVSYFVLDEEKTEELIKTHFLNEETPAQAEEKKEDKIGFFDKLKNKRIKVQILNGSHYPDAEVFAKTQVERLGYSVSETRKLEKVYYKKTQIIDHTGKIKEDTFASVFEVCDFIRDNDKESGADVTIVIGDNA